jgi:hypothetical protein
VKENACATVYFCSRSHAHGSLGAHTVGIVGVEASVAEIFSALLTLWTVLMLNDIIVIVSE